MENPTAATGILSGVSCIAAIANFHGLDVPESQVAHLAGMQPAAASPRQLARLAEKVGLTAKPCKLSWERLGRLGPVWPAILVLSNGESLILSGLKDTDGKPEIVVRDPRVPQAGFQFWGRAQTLQKWDGDLVLLKRDYKLADANQPFSLRWFVPKFLQERRALVDVVAASLVMQLLSLATPLFLQIVIDRVVTYRSEATLIVLVVGVTAAIGFEGILTFVRSYLLLHMTSKVDLRLTSQIFGKLLSLPMDFFERNLAGVLIKHVQQDQQIREFLSGRLLLSLLDASALLVFIPILCLYSIILTIVVMICALLLAGIIAGLAIPFRRRLNMLYRAEADRQAALVEAIHGINTVKSLGLEPKQAQVWDRRAADVIERRIQVGVIGASARAVSGSIQKVMLVAVITVGVSLILGGELTVGALVAFQIIAARVTNPLVQIAGLINEFQETALSVEMLGNVMNATSEPGIGRGLRAPIRGGVNFEEVSFSYPNTTMPALDRVSFSIEPGQVVGVVGRSGSGKSTLLRLIQGLYPVQQGFVRIDGHDMRELDKIRLRSQIGVVLQDSFLFRGTVRDNIASGLPGASFEDIVWSAQQAGAVEFIERLADGYDTILEEGGVNLSGGQKQRIAIARALLRRPRIMIFDEATSALDPESEVIIQDNLSRIVAGRTAIIVSHRLSSIRDCHKILVLEKGRVIGFDAHDALINSCEQYRRLWEKQTKSFR